MTLYVVNNFSLNMIKDQPPAFSLRGDRVTPEQASSLVNASIKDQACIVSIGNDMMADAFMEHMEQMGVYPPEPRRSLIAAGPEDVMLWVISEGPKHNNGHILPVERLRYYVMRAVGEPAKFFNPNTSSEGRHAQQGR